MEAEMDKTGRGHGRRILPAAHAPRHEKVGAGGTARHDKASISVQANRQRRPEPTHRQVLSAPSLPSCESGAGEDRAKQSALMKPLRYKAVKQKPLSSP
jgi:hypothetical protein